MTATTPHLIGIAGRSGSGKTTLAGKLAELLAAGTTVLSIDSYYHDLGSAPRSDLADHNFDSPDAIDAPLLFDHVTRMAAGHAIDVPIYNFASHSRSSRSIRVTPGRWVIVEGLFALLWPALLDLYATRIFIDADDVLCLSRRIARDTIERGRDRNSVVMRYRNTVRPMAAAHILPTRRCADFTLPASWPPADAAAYAHAEILRRTTRHEF